MVDCSRGSIFYQAHCTVVIERKIYVMGGDDKHFKVYDVDQGKLMEYL